METLNTLLEPLLQLLPPLATGQKKDAEAHLAEDDRIDGELTLVSP